jgi:hypothetical protein
MLAGCVLAVLLGECVLQVVVRSDLLPDGNDYVAFARRGVNTLPASARLYREAADPVLAVELVPGARRDGIRVSTAGTRGAEFAPAPAPGTLRIAVVGDSETFGAALAEATTLPAVLERAIGELAAAGAACTAEVLNFGFPGYNLEQVLHVATTRAVAAAADVVVYYYVLNDPITPGIDRVEDGAALDRSALVLLAKWLYHSYVPSAYFYRSMDRDARLVDYYGELHRGAAWVRVRDGLARASAALAARGVGFVVVIAPELVGYGDFAQYPFAAVGTRLAALDGPGLAVIDALPPLRDSGLPPRAFWTSNTDPHKNAAANARIGPWLARELSARGLLACPRQPPAPRSEAATASVSQ